MKFLNIVFTIFLLCLIYTTTLGEEESPKKSNLLLRRPGMRSGPLNKSTTTTAMPTEEGEFGDEEYDQSEDIEEKEKQHDEIDASPTTTTSTESSKKIGPIIRPFRSNDDLLLALKRRQMNVKKGVAQEKSVTKVESAGSEKEEEEELAPAAKSSNDRASRRRFGREGVKPIGAADDVSTPVEEQTAKKPSRFALKSLRNN